tara:strand:+ start:655 stop:996 length:342 start_codon:yes stop_codon:yes gene_type:complete
MQKPTPEQVKAARTAVGHSQTQAAETIYKATRTWQQWEAGDRVMDPALFELYCIKANKIINSDNEINLVRQWFDSVQDLNSEFLQTDDYILAKKIYTRLGMRVPHSITDNLPV